MELMDYIKKYAQRTRVSITKNRETAIDYLMKHELPSYFSDEVSENEKKLFRKSLEDKLNTSMDKYDKELGGIIRRSATRGSMALTLANDIYSYYFSKQPFSYPLYVRIAAVGLKTAMEIPALYSYLKKSHDFYGAIKHILMKPVNALLPIVGPALEAGSFERMVMKGILKETKYNFIKEFGDYVSSYDQAKSNLKIPLRDVSYKEKVPKKKAA